ncbi:MAG: dihydrolipoamide acetyltransferase family protein [Polyangiales bacterium]
MSTNVTMPQLGESVVEGTIGRWLVSEGDHVEKDQPIVEILTDKADTEVPSPIAGTVSKLFAAVDDVVAVGGVLCEIDENGAASATSAGAAKPSAEKVNASTQAAPQTSAGVPAGGAPTSPSVRRIAREHNVDLNRVSGSGPGGRITKDDVLDATETSAGTRGAASQDRPATAPPAPSAPTAPQAAATATVASNPSGAFRMPPYVQKPGDEIVPFTRRRRIIADHMVFSKHTAPDVVTFAECDLHKSAKLRDAHKAQYKKDGTNLTYLSFCVAATARALKEFPEINSRVLDDAFVKIAEVNIGIAVDTDEGLVVPVIRHADELTVRGIARAIDDLATRARSGALKPDDLANKTFTVSNPGLKGNLVGGAIISQPNVGILRLGTIKKRVVVIEHEGEDLMAIHPVMHMALTYDHRVVDGVHANGFLYRIGEILEQADFEL